MEKFKELWKGEWISVVSPEKHPYEAVHEDDLIMVLPILKIKRKKDVSHYVAIRKEHCPPYMIKDTTDNELYYTIISGKLDIKGESKEKAMIREMEEETGIKITDYEILEQKENMPVFKTSDVRTDLYFILIKEFERVEAEGDGTYNEEQSEVKFIKVNELDKILEKENIDFLLYGAINILKNIFREKDD